LATWKATAVALGGVLGMLASIATISLWLAPGWSPGAWLRARLAWIWRATIKLLTLGVPLWVLLASGVLLAFGAPTWTILVLAALLVVAVRIADALEAPPELPPLPWHSYTSDVMFGVRWDWWWGRGIDIDRCAALCRFDENELVASDFLGRLRLNCSLCGRSWEIGHYPELPSDIAAREIRRRVRAELWQGAVERLNAPADPNSGRQLL